jgi:hypothetical protein
MVALRTPLRPRSIDGCDGGGGATAVDRRLRRRRRRALDGGLALESACLSSLALKFNIAVQ